MTRGERNNNPLNIRRTTDRWLGMAAEQTDSEFVVFTDVKYGIRAAIKIIRRYVLQFHCNTIRKIITRWAPPTENKTDAYVAYVAHHAGLNADALIPASDIASFSLIICAMSFYESNMAIQPSTIIGWWKDYFPSTT